MSQSSEEVPSPLPPVLYKYYEFNEWTQAIFEKNEIYFQSPDCFNDPFDSKLAHTYKGTEDQRISRLIACWRKEGVAFDTDEITYAKTQECAMNGQDVAKVMDKGTAERLRKRLGVFCMTTDKQNLLMWSHYANAHTGFCLEFNTANECFRERTFPILYPEPRSERPQLNLIEDINSGKMIEALFTKAVDWEYEDEWRIVDQPKGPGVKQFPAEALTSVYLGCRITPENRNRIMNWCRERSPRPEVYWAEEKTWEFGLDFTHIEWG